MKRLVTTFALIIFCSVAWPLRADDAAKPAAAKPETITDAIVGLPENGGKAVETLGHQGCLVMRSAVRYESVMKKLVAAGWAGKDALPKVDWDKQDAVLLYNYGDQGDRFSVRDFTGDADKARLDVLLNYMSYKSYRAPGKRVSNFNFILAIVPKSNSLTVSVSTTENPLGADAAKKEWQATFGAEAGDIVDGLRVAISCDAKTVKAGQDILIAFKLELADPATRKPGYFSRAVEKIIVWDGANPVGYHDHAFVVRTPDGVIRFLQPAEADWGGNVPHPVAMTAEAPYVLPGDSGTKGVKSLKLLGLDTSKPGKYVITGIYSESRCLTTGSRAPGTVAGEEDFTWGGDIATNTITVEVTKD